MKKKFSGKALASILAAACMLNVSLVPQVTYAVDPAVFEFEDGSHPNSSVKEDADASGGKYVFLEKNEESISVNADVPSAGMYDIVIRYSAPYGDKIQNLVINGVDQGQVSFTSKDWTEVKALTAKLNSGENEITIKGSWGWTNFDYIRCEQAVLPDITGHDRTPCDQKSTDSAKKLMAYLADTYGSNIISGQQEIYKYGPHDFEYEFDYIKDKTGKTPAIRGFDYLNCNPLYGSEDGTTERIIDWVNTKGGIATSSWHITVPKQFSSYVLKETNVDWGNATYEPDKTDFDTSKAITEGTKEYEYYMWCLDLLAAELKKLQDADVPLIFRPLHEAEGGGGESGSWFWWGKSGSKVYKELWKLTYKTLTEKYDLHNLIWEWNSYAYETSADWYPGDEYVDIIAYDKYNCTDWSTGNPVLNHNDSAISGTFYSIVEKYKGKKMVAMAENDSIPTLENLLGEKAAWLYFCPWYDGGQDNNNFLSNPVFNKAEDLKEIYQSDYCITLDELPDLKNYETGNVTPTKPTETTSDAEETTKPTETTVSSESTESSEITESTDPSSETTVLTNSEETTVSTNESTEIISDTTESDKQTTISSEKTTESTTENTTKPTTEKNTKPTTEKTTSKTTKPTTGKTTATKQTTTIQACYAASFDCDMTPMKVGERRAVRVYNPETGKTKGIEFSGIVENDIYSFEYTEGSDTFYITALSPGEIKFDVWEKSCAFTTQFVMTVEKDSAPPESSKTTTALTTDKPESKTTASTKETDKTTKKSTESTGKNTAASTTATKITTTKKPNTNISTVSVPSSVKASKYGDINTDGKVNIADVVALNLHLLSSSKYSLTDVQLANADCVKDNIVNTADSTLLMNFVAELADYSQLGK